jgi:nucleoside-triphosphatase THEP1
MIKTFVVKKTLTIVLLLLSNAKCWAWTVQNIHSGKRYIYCQAQKKKKKLPKYKYPVQSLNTIESTYICILG